MSIERSQTQTVSLAKMTLTERKFPDKLPGPEYRMEIDWYYTFLVVVCHTAAVYSFFLPEKPLYTGLYVYVAYILNGFGITVGTHRLFTHKTFKANAPLRILLITLQTFGIQRSVYTWVNEHRLHHKYTDTNADPHNSSRGFFFSHVGWLMVKAHPDVEKYGETIDLSDLKADPFVMFQYRYYVPLTAVTVIVSTMIPYLGWGESLQASFFFGFLARYALYMNATWFVNSAAHFFGTKPYDINISSTDNNIVSFLAVGEGFHNYHHAFPWDYKAAELGNYSLNFSTAFIDFMAKIGWATDLKTVSDDLIRKRILRTGGLNNNQSDSKTVEEEARHQVWGWDDPAMQEDDKKLAVILNKKDAD